MVNKEQLEAAENAALASLHEPIQITLDGTGTMQLHEPHTITGQGHPRTSFDAAVRALGRSGASRWRVLHAICAEPAGLTDDELQRRLRLPANTQRPRRLELVRAGWVNDSGQRRPTVTGAQSIVWTATDQGREVLDETYRRSQR